MKTLFYRLLKYLFGDPPTCRYCGSRVSSYRKQFCSLEHEDQFWEPLDRSKV